MTGRRHMGLVAAAATLLAAAPLIADLRAAGPGWSSACIAVAFVAGAAALARHRAGPAVGASCSP